MKTRVLIVLALGLFLGQCSGDGALIQPLADGLTNNDGSLSETPDGDADNSGTITGNPTGEPGSSDFDSVPSTDSTQPVEGNPGNIPDVNDEVNDENSEDTIVPNPEDDGDTVISDQPDADVDAPGYVDGDADPEDENEAVVPEVSADPDQDAPGYVNVDPDPEDYNDDVVPSTPEVPNPMAQDDDGDGLANAIDPRPTQVDMWGFIDADNQSMSTYETSSFTYRYISGSKSTLQVQKQTDSSALLSDEVAPSSGPTLKVQPTPQTNSYGIVVANGIRVTGLLDRNQARLPTVNSIAAATETGLAHNFEYGIYVKYRNITIQRR